MTLERKSLKLYLIIWHKYNLSNSISGTFLVFIDFFLFQTEGFFNIRLKDFFKQVLFGLGIQRWMSVLKKSWFFNKLAAIEPAHCTWKEIWINCFHFRASNICWRLMKKENVWKLHRLSWAGHLLLEGAGAETSLLYNNSIQDGIFFWHTVNELC